MKYRTDDLRINAIKEVASPESIREEYPLTDRAAETAFSARQCIQNILHMHDDRCLVVVGPCSIHDTVAALEYAERLQALREQLIDELFIVMRVYFEKPRTTVGWKGLINDPDLDGSFRINKGLRLARQLLLNINELGVPAGTEFLDLITPQYIADLVSWGAIGARTTESQVHRELASGLSCPVGFKNGTDGNLKIAIDAIRSAGQPHIFLSLTKQGRSAIFSTTGNQDCHIILRGGKQPNYDAVNVQAACEALRNAKLECKIMIDCSHANSRKKHENQSLVCADIAHQIGGGDPTIIGTMLESHLVAGRQDVKPGRALTYGQSITDPCIDWQQTETVLLQLAQAVRQRRKA